jgi:hypothetical protein
MAQDLHRKASEKGEDVIIPQELSSRPPISNTTSDNNSKKIEGEANPITQNTKGEKLEEDRYDIEELPSTRRNLLIDNDYEDNGGSVDYDYFLGGY